MGALKTKKQTGPKLGHVPIQMRPLWLIFPSSDNDKLYRPVSNDDPEIVALAESIRTKGLLDPLVITTDDFILSGHRRHAAARLAGLEEVPVRVYPISVNDPGFLPLLREFNRQRVKTLDEVTREEVVSANPEEAHRILLEHRRKRSLVRPSTIEIEGTLRRAKITAAKAPMLAAIRGLLEEWHAFWPLTDRRIHYGLLNNPPLIHAAKSASIYRNDATSYKALCELLTRARLAGEISFEAIDDPTRPETNWQLPPNASSFVREQLDGFLKDYYRDLLQSQPNYVQIVGEKNTIESVIRPVAMDYCIPYLIGRGYSSLAPRHHLAERFKRSGKEKLVLLVLSDFDPEGEDIAHSFARSMRDDFEIENVAPIKVALTSEQVQRMKLPPQMTAKAGSSRRAKFVDRHGENVFELEAMPPDRLQTILRNAIDSVIDRKAFNAEIENEKQDAAYLDGVRRQLLARIGAGGSTSLN